MTKPVSKILQRRFRIAEETNRLQNLVHCGLSMIISAQIFPTHPSTYLTMKMRIAMRLHNTRGSRLKLQQDRSWPIAQMERGQIGLAVKCLTAPAFHTRHYMFPPRPQQVGAFLNSGVLGMRLAPLVMEGGREGLLQRGMESASKYEQCVKRMVLSMQQ